MRPTAYIEPTPHQDPREMQAVWDEQMREINAAIRGPEPKPDPLVKAAVMALLIGAVIVLWALIIKMAGG